MRAGAAMRELSLRHRFTVQLACTDDRGRLTIRAVFLGVLSEAQVDDWVTYLDETFFALALAGGLGGTQFEPGLHDHPFDCEVRTDHSAPGTLIEWAMGRSAPPAPQVGQASRRKPCIKSCEMCMTPRPLVVT